MKNELIIKIDLEKITSDVLEKETYSEGYTGNGIIQERVKNELKDWIKTSIVDEIKNNLNLKEFKERGYAHDYLKLTANQILEENLGDLVKDKTEDWVKKNIRWIIEKQAEKTIEEFLVPRLQKMINNLLIVNTENLENEMQQLKDDYESQIKDIEESAEII